MGKPKNGSAEKNSTSERATTPLSRSAVSREIVLGVTDTSQMDRQGKEKSMMLRFGGLLPSQAGSCTVSILKSLSFVRVHILFVGIWHRDRLQSHGFPVGLAPALPLQPTRDKIVIVRLGREPKKFVDRQICIMTWRKEEMENRSM